MYGPFQLFGPGHLGALGVIVLACIVITGALRSSQEGRVRRGAAVGIAALLVVYARLVASRPGFEAIDWLPLHLCDFSIFLAGWALWTRGQSTYELTGFWGMTGTLLAMITPSLYSDFPSPEFVVYFAAHGSVVLAAVGLTFGAGMRPRPSGMWRALGWLNVYAAAVALVNVALDANYLWLRRKPAADTLLDWFGPWPMYLVVCDLIALALFAALQVGVLRLAPNPGASC